MDITFSQTSPVEAFRTLATLSPPEGQKYAVYTYLLNSEVCGKDGQPDNLYGFISIIGCYPTMVEAQNKCREILQKYPLRNAKAVKLGYPAALKITPDPEAVTYLTANEKGQLEDIQTIQWKKDQEIWKKRTNLEKEIGIEKEKEIDPEDYEYYRNQWYLAIKNKSLYEVKSKESLVANNNYDQHVKNIREAYRKHPEHDIEFLSRWKEKLINRDEYHLYQAIEKSYLLLRDEILSS